MELRKLLFLVAIDPQNSLWMASRALQIASLIPHRGRGTNKSKRWKV